MATNNTFVAINRIWPSDLSSGQTVLYRQHSISHVAGLSTAHTSILQI